MAEADDDIAIVLDEADSAMEKTLESLRKELQRVRAGKADNFEENKHLRALVDRISMIYDETAYRRYFEDRVPDDINHFGEITPSYSVLNPEGFEDARSQFKNIRVILLLRDPIQRHYSLMKMKEKILLEDMSPLKYRIGLSSFLASPHHSDTPRSKRLSGVPVTLGVGSRPFATKHLTKGSVRT